MNIKPIAVGLLFGVGMALALNSWLLGIMFGIIGFVFGLSALAKVIMLEKQLKESGVLKEKTESDDK